MKTLSLFLFLVFLSSCSLDTTQIAQLHQENEHLRDTIKMMRQQLKKVNAMVVVMPKANHLKLGDDYEANVFLVPYEKGQIATSTAYIKTAKPAKSDTLKFSGKNSDLPYLKFHPSDTGTYILRGDFHETFLGKSYNDMVYQMEFDVTP